MKWAFALALLLLAQAVAAKPLDSQIVLERYTTRLLHEEGPKVLVFSYTVSQLGPRDIEETHRVYRSGDLVRDETLLVDGVRQKNIRIARYRNRYTLDNLAPRVTQYAFLFQRSSRSGGGLQYVYRAVPLGAAGGFVVDAMTIDGRTFLPSVIHFHTTGSAMQGSGTVAFTGAGKYWVPLAANVEARIGGKPARERIAFTAYQFPASLPKSTFQSPRRLQAPALPTF